MSWHVRGDWGTSNLRLYRIESGVVTARTDGPGIGALAGTAAEALRQAMAPWCVATPPARITLCGMAGSRNGLHDVAYLDCPVNATKWAGAAHELAFDNIPLRLAPGLACENRRGGPDVMRGEEAQIFGALALEPGLGDAALRIILPGTHSKWTVVRDGRIESFRTCVTGELFALLRDQSILLAAGSGDAIDPGDEARGFDAGLERAAEGGGAVGSLFEVRAQQLRAGHARGWAQGFLSGLIIGNEIVDMRAADGLPDAVVLIGAAALTERYTRALGRFDVTATQMHGDTCALRGLELIDADH